MNYLEPFQILPRRVYPGEVNETLAYQEWDKYRLAILGETIRIELERALDRILGETTT